jgi:cation diffusion facilitator family transporter
MSTHSEQADREKRRASLISVLAVLGLIVLKVAVGLITGSLGILAQAADSVLDMVAAVVAFFAVRVAAQPPDADHPYGHGKVENLAALAEAVLLFLTCAWITYEAVQRLFFRPVAIEAGIWGLAVMVLSIATSIWLSVYLLRVARRYRSQSLEGNALNFRADVLSASVVLLGLALSSLANLLGPGWAWLAQADAVAALIVVLLVLRVSFRLGWQAASELLDVAPSGLAERISAEASSVPGVEDVGAVRVRQVGASTFVDMAVKVGRSASLEEAYQVASQVEERVGALVDKEDHSGAADQVDVVVQVDPVRHADESLHQTVGAIASRFGLRTHNVHAHTTQGNTFVDLHVEVPPELTLAEAYHLVASLEETIRVELPHIGDIHSHIEPLAVPSAPAALDFDEDQSLREQVSRALEGIPGLHGCHDFYLRPGHDGYDVVVHCLANPDLPVGEAHRLADQAERQIHSQVPGVASVLIHVEPDDSPP